MLRGDYRLLRIKAFKVSASLKSFCLPCSLLALWLQGISRKINNHVYLAVLSKTMFSVFVTVEAPLLWLCRSHELVDYGSTPAQNWGRYINKHFDWSVISSLCILHFLMTKAERSDKSHMWFPHPLILVLLLPVCSQKEWLGKLWVGLCFLTCATRRLNDFIELANCSFRNRS